MSIPTLHLIEGVARRVQRGHFWVFSNEVARIDPSKPAPGTEVCVVDHRGRVMGMALLSPSSLIRARIYLRRAGEVCDGEYLKRALAAAMARRRRYLADPLPHSYRLAHSDADGLPGLTVDVFGDHAVLQITTAAMELRREAIIEAIRAVVAPRVLIEKSDSPVRTLENLQPRSEVIFGTPDVPVRIEENGIVALADLVGGQKTGYYLDQVENRRRARRWFAGARVLDAFCYVGAWSLVAADAGAVSVMAVDSSQLALDMLAAARALNPAAQQCPMELVRADAFEHLRALAAQNAKFDAIVLDPPPLARSAKDRENALRAYRDLNRQGLKLLAPGGVLISSCCSHAVSAADFRRRWRAARGMPGRTPSSSTRRHSRRIIRCICTRRRRATSRRLLWECEDYAGRSLWRILATMRHFILSAVLLVTMSALACSAKPIRVAVYADEGAMEPYISKAAEAAESAGMTVTRVKAADIVGGALEEQDVIVFPGGTGNGLARSLGESASPIVREFAARGGGVIGVCAGGYLLAEGYNEGTNRLELINAQLWDLDNWARGEGTVQIRRADQPDSDPITIKFENAPVFEPGKKGLDLPPYVPLAKFVTDVVAEPQGRESMAGHDAIIAAPYGEGRVVLFGPHPELTPGLEPLFQNALKWAARKGDAEPGWEAVLEGGE